MKSSCRSDALTRLLFVVAFAITLLFAAPAVKAQVDITTTVPLSFGRIAIYDYNTVGRITVLTNGFYTANANIAVHDVPQRGEYHITGGPANSAYTVSLPPSATLTGPGGTFLLDNFVVTPGVLITDAAGEDDFYISARLQTQGGGVNYGDGAYNSTFIVTVAF